MLVSRLGLSQRRAIDSKTLPAKNSPLRVLWNRSTLPVVVGLCGAVSR